MPGNHVYLTIDIQLQEAVERALANGIISLQERDQENAKAIQEGRTDEVREDVKEGAVVVVDVDTGEPLAIASYPTFDASQILDADYFAEITDVATTPTSRAHSITTPCRARYAPGSTFKPLTALAALTENIINTETRIDCEGVFSKYAEGLRPPLLGLRPDRRLDHARERQCLRGHTRLVQLFLLHYLRPDGH